MDSIVRSICKTQGDIFEGTSKNSFLPKFLTWLELFFENHTELSW